MTATVRIPVGDPSRVAEARRIASGLAESVGLDGTRTEHVSILATELATNLLKHAGGGELLVRAMAAPEPAGVELLSIDRGPGMRRLAESLQDGFSTSGGTGTGLGAVARLSSRFDVHTASGQGTVLLSRVEAAPTTAATPPVEMGAVCVPIAGERVSGDAWAVQPSPGKFSALLADGLGHGPDAHEAAVRAVASFRVHAAAGVTGALKAIHLALHGSRGAAVGVADLLAGQRKVSFGGLGNVTGRVIGAASDRSMLAHHGTAGMHAARLEATDYAWPEGALVVLHSDGLAGSWDLASWPGLLDRHPAVVAGVLYRDHRRTTDDCSVLVLRAVRRGR